MKEPTEKWKNCAEKTGETRIRPSLALIRRGSQGCWQHAAGELVGGRKVENKTEELSLVSEDLRTIGFLEQKGVEVPRPFARDILLMVTMIHGAMHVEGIHDLAAELQEGDRVRLVLEPDNPVDPMAILVKNARDQKLGYIPRAKNVVLYHLMDAGKLLYGIIIGGDVGENLDPEDRWLEIYIDVYMVD